MPSWKIAFGPDDLVMPNGVISSVRGIPLLAPPECMIAAVAILGSLVGEGGSHVRRYSSG